MALRMTENHTELSFRYMRIEGRKEKLLDFLLRKFRYLDREEWLENIREKRLTVDGRNADPLQLLKDHQKILYLRPDFLEPEVDSSFDKIFEDDFLVAFNKPGNLPTSPSGKYYKNTLVNLAKKSTAGKNSSPFIAWTGKPAESSFLQNKKRLPKKWQKCSENNKPVNFTKPYLKTAYLQMMLLCPCR